MNTVVFHSVSREVHQRDVALAELLNKRIERFCHIVSC